MSRTTVCVKGDLTLSGVGAWHTGEQFAQAAEREHDAQTTVEVGMATVGDGTSPDNLS